MLQSGAAASGGPILAAAGSRDTLLLTATGRRTPLALSCTGRPVPRLAAAWSSDSSRKAWTLVLPAATDAATAWRERPEAGAALRWAGVASVVPLDQHRLVVTFGTAQATVPGIFADPALAQPAGEGDPPPFRFLEGVGADLRDALDRGADIVITSDPAVLDYASTHATLTRHPLPWNRTYVLLAGGSSPFRGGPAIADSAAFREALARDAVRVAARGAEPPFWWEESAGCARAAARDGPAEPAVVYPLGDPVARALAERVVAMTDAPGALARGVPDGDLIGAISQGAGSAYLLPLPRVALVPCREMAAWPAGFSAVPLIDTRPTAVLAAGTPPLTVEYDGGLLPLEPR